MPQPTKYGIHVNRPLTDLSVAFIQQASDFVAGNVFPMVNVSKQSDRYFQYARKQWFKTVAQKRARATESVGGGWDIDNTPSYFCDVFAVHKDVAWQDLINQDEAINLNEEATRWVTQQLLLKKDKEWFDAYFKPSIWGSDFTPGTLWSAGGSTPVKDVRAQKRLIHKRTGFMPNILVVSPDVDDMLKDHADLLDRVKYTQTGIINNALIAAAFEVDKYIVGSAIEDTADEGQAEAMAYLGTRDALLCYAPPSPGLYTPSAGYTFAWSGYMGGASNGMAISSFDIREKKCDRVEGEMAFDMKLVASELGTFFNNVIA